jgi:hypothetical protein
MTLAGAFKITTPENANPGLGASSSYGSAGVPALASRDRRSAELGFDLIVHVNEEGCASESSRIEAKALQRLFQRRASACSRSRAAMA